MEDIKDMVFICSLIYFITAFLFGTAISFLLAGVRFCKDNLVHILVFCCFEGILQFTILYFNGVAVTRQLYPFLTHLPLVIVLILLFKKSPLTSIVSVFSAYLCCQIPWWIAFFFNVFFSNEVIHTTIYVVSAIIVSVAISRYASDTIDSLISNSRKNAVFIGTVPFLYYIFDYTGTVYTNWLYRGNIAMVQFMPFVIACFYLLFIAMYYKELSSKEEAKHQAGILKLQLQHAASSLLQMRRLEDTTITYRHDMRHHLSYIQALVSSHSYDKISEYIASIQSDLDSITPKKYCQNELVNLIFSTYALKYKDTIVLDTQINLPEQITITDSHLCVLLSNALENAINSTIKTSDRTVIIKLTTRGASLMLLISNPYSHEIIWKNGLPSSLEPSHGYGVKSIAAIVDFYNGQYEFSAENNIFTLRVLLPL